MEKPTTWNDKINLIGKKVEDPRLHLCEKCNFPILIYGRMIPCKHVFCFDCAKTIDKVCIRCGDNVTRVEQSLQGHIFMCNFGFPKHSHQGCRRTYLSQRDLQAHVNHRHKKQSSKSQSSSKERRVSDPRTEPRGERVERRTDGSRGDPRLDGNRPDPRLEARTSTYQQVQNYTVEPNVQAPSGDYGMTQAPQTGVPPPSGMVPPPSSGMVPPASAMVPPSSGMVQPPGGMVPPPSSDRDDYHVTVRNTNLITVPIQDSGADYQAPLPYASSAAPPQAVPVPPPVQGQYPGPVPVDHQAVRPQPQMAYPVAHGGSVMTPQAGASGYPPTGRAMPPQAGPYIGGPQTGPHYDQPPPPPSSSYGPPPPASTTFSAPVSGSWTQPTQSLSVPGPASDGLAPKPAHPSMPDSTTYTPGSYY